MIYRRPFEGVKELINYWKLITLGFKSCGIRASMIPIAGVEAEDGKVTKIVVVR
jgi:hypothetical protein